MVHPYQYPPLCIAAMSTIALDNIPKLKLACEVLDQEKQISQCTTLKEINLKTNTNVWPLIIAKDLQPLQHLITLVNYYLIMFTWSYEDMQGLDPQFYRHQIYLKRNSTSIQQYYYNMNPNYAYCRPMGVNLAKRP